MSAVRRLRATNKLNTRGWVFKLHFGNFNYLRSRYPVEQYDHNAFLAAPNTPTQTLMIKATDYSNAYQMK
jgi:hypothetical protein